ncbi:MAG TPA: hypothetical protein VK828_06735 [Terriglobales bacterium]|nr:hypothetical protein [Terriglobales bacterium]
MNSTRKINDGSNESEETMLQQNDTAKVNVVQEIILLPGEDSTSPSANRAEDWRDLARQIQAEPDSTKLVDLVQQLIAKFDEQTSRPLQPKAK